MANDKKKIEYTLALRISDFQKSVTLAVGQIDALGSRITKSLGGSRKELEMVSGKLKGIGLAAGAAATGGVILFAATMRSSVESAVQMEKINLAFGAITGNAGLAGRELAFVETESKRLGISFSEAAHAYKGIFAASQGTVLAGRETQKIFTGIAAASSALGLSSDQTAGALLAVSQMISKGKISAEELRGQLGERLPGAFQLMAQAAGVSTAALDKMLVAGNVGIDLLPKFAQILIDKYGKAAVAADGFIKAQSNVSNEYFKLKTAAGQIVTQNTFVIDSLKILAGVMGVGTEAIKANRDSLVNLVKDGFVSLVGAVSMSIGGVQNFYNAWQGLGLVAHGVTWLIIKGMELSVQAIRSALLPLDLLLQGMVKVGAINSNPLQDWQKTLAGVSKISGEEFNALLQKITETNTSFDQAKAKVDEWKNKIAEIPATFKELPGEAKKTTDATVKEIKQIDGVWTNVYNEVGKKSDETTKKQKENTESVSGEIKLVGEVWTNTHETEKKTSDDATAVVLSNIAKIKAAAASIKYPSPGGGGKAEGFARGGNPFHGGLGGFGGGDRRLIMVEDGEHVIRKEAVKKLGHGFFQRFNLLDFPGFSVGGDPFQNTATATAAGSMINLTVNYSGSASRTDIDGLTKAVMSNLEKAYRGRK